MVDLAIPAPLSAIVLDFLRPVSDAAHKWRMKIVRMPVQFVQNPKINRSAPEKRGNSPYGRGKTAM
jgi:hypothetical protein